MGASSLTQQAMALAVEADVGFKTAHAAVAYGVGRLRHRTRARVEKAAERLGYKLPTGDVTVEK